MGKCDLKPYRLDSDLTGYMPVPRALTQLELPSTAVLIYAALLDRATLSRKNRYADSGGWVYVIYPVEALAACFHISDTAVKRHLRELETRGLIRRQRQRGNAANHIYLNIPAESLAGTKCPVPEVEKDPAGGRKVPPNNRKKQPDRSNYYQHGEDESL